jgi:hypothetical protein
VGSEIYNYSFESVTKFAPKLDIVELTEEENESLKAFFEFEFLPTHQEISDRCIAIVQQALKKNHSAVFIRNYDSFQSFLVQEFQKNGISVFVPYYQSYTELTTDLENQNFNDIIELPLISHPLFTVSNVTMSIDDGNYQLFILGELEITQVRFDLVNGKIDDIFKWFDLFVERIKKQRIQTYLVSSFGLLFGNQDFFVEELIRILDLMNEEITVQSKESINSEMIREMSEIIQTISIIDSAAVQKYLALTDHAIKEGKHNFKNSIILLNMAIDQLNRVDLKTKDVIIRFDTKSFVKLGINRYYTMKLNPAILCRYLGFYYLISKLYIDAEHNLQSSIGLYHCYSQNEIDYQEIDKTLLNLIYVNITLSRYDVAKLLIQDRISEIRTDDHDLLSKLKGLLSTIYRNTGEYSLALDTINEDQLNFDIDSNPEEYYHLELRKAMVYYMEDKIPESLLLVNSIISNQNLTTLMRSHSRYIYSLILFSDEKRVSDEQLVKLAQYRGENIGYDSYFRLVEILSLIEKEGPTGPIKEKLIELAYLYPRQEINVFPLLGTIYTKQGDWSALSFLIDNMTESYSQYSPLLQIKFYMCKYYLGIIEGSEDAVVKNKIETLAQTHMIDIPSLDLNNSEEYAINQITKILDMDLLKLEIQIFD